MKKCITVLTLALLLVTGFVSRSKAQNELVGVEYRNIVVAADGLSFTFEVWAFSIEPAYTNAAAPWNSFNIRLDVDLVGGATGIGVMTAANVTPGIAQAGLPSNNPPGGTGPKIGLALSRAGGADLTAAPQRLATITVPVTGGIVTGATMLITRASPTVPGGTQTFWNSTVSPNTRRPLTIPDATPLPVTLVSFTAAAEGSVTQLKWATTQETNAERFDIQRSSNAKKWNTIGTKAAAGESSALLNYGFTDITPVNGTNYYRLKMVDKDGTTGYSRIVSADFEDTGIKLYPNPVTNVLFLKDVELKDVKEVSVVNASGVSVYKARSVSTDGINVAGFTSGIYIVKVTKTDGTTTPHKIVITK